MNDNENYDYMENYAHARERVWVTPNERVAQPLTPDWVGWVTNPHFIRVARESEGVREGESRSHPPPDASGRRCNSWRVRERALAPQWAIHAPETHAEAETEREQESDIPKDNRFSHFALCRIKTQINNRLPWHLPYTWHSLVPNQPGLLSTRANRRRTTTTIIIKVGMVFEYECAAWVIGAVTSLARLLAPLDSLFFEPAMKTPRRLGASIRCRRPRGQKWKVDAATPKSQPTGLFVYVFFNGGALFLGFKVALRRAFCGVVPLLNPASCRGAPSGRQRDDAACGNRRKKCFGRRVFAFAASKTDWLCGSHCTPLRPMAALADVTTRNPLPPSMYHDSGISLSLSIDLHEHVFCVSAIYIIILRLPFCFKRLYCYSAGISPS